MVEAKANASDMEGFLSRVEMGINSKIKSMEYAQASRDYNASLCKKECRKCGIQQSFDEVCALVYP